MRNKIMEKDYSRGICILENNDFFFPSYVVDTLLPTNTFYLVY